MPTCVHFDILIVTTVTKCLIWIEGNWLHKLPRNAGFSITARDPAIVLIESISGYLNCLLEFEELGFPLNVKIGVWFVLF